MNIVLDNIIYGKEKNGGISNYWYEVTRFLLQEEMSDVQFFDVNANNYYRNKLSQIINPAEILKTEKPGLRSRALPVYYNSKEKFIYHSSYYRKLIGSKNHVEITTVHDFIHDYYFSLLKRKLHNQYKYSAIERAKGIICVSKNTYSDLKKFCNISKNKSVEVIYNGVSTVFKNTEVFSAEEMQFILRNGLDDKYLLFVGGRTAYKNFDFTLELLKQLPDFKLVVVGNPFSQKEQNKIGEILLSRITVLSGISSCELNIIYNRAFALLYPSMYEGFGMPVIEAMRAGCPVLALNRSSVKEIAEKGTLLFDNPDVNLFKQALQNLEKIDFKTQLVAEGLEHSKLYSWEKCSKETYSFYESVFSKFS
jgi:glycosyltransferase involved in cell wall biosynthesis